MTHQQLENKKKRLGSELRTLMGVVKCARANAGYQRRNRLDRIEQWEENAHFAQLRVQEKKQELVHVFLLSISH